ncbi:ribonuclease J [Mycoplasma todarodis]|uniref:Ribonuclease J n=1 Tax=Mycoplasma todarodis TaxID=1937191 RepID=A0A4R0XQN3_9MOLU|nr:ribonuclease J [Mycoplasma todarodis]TCG10660.1 ribonuclease J [Mycoplasma todarodis]
MANINIFALGGQDENGKNCYAIEVNNDTFIVDAGIKLPVVSKLGVDTIIPTFDYITKNSKKIKGVFISHGHDEVFAALPWLLMATKGLKIYGSKFTVDVIKERVSKYKIGHNDYSINIIDKDTKFGDVVVKPFELAHSIPGTLGYNFSTEDGDILYMTNYVVGDLGKYGKTDLEVIKKSTSEKGILALLAESARSSYIGSAFDKSSVKPVVSETFKTTPADQRIIVGAYDEEMYTLQEILDLAIEANRPVITYGRAYSTLIKTFVKQNPDAKLPKFIDYKLAEKTNNAVILVTGTGERLYQRFIRICEGNDVFLKFRKEDTVIMIAPPINGLEKTAARTLDLISRNLRRIYDVSEKDYYKFNPAREDIFNTISILKPRNFIPISGLFRYLKNAERIAEEAHKFTKSITLQNGKIALFKDGKLASTNGKIKEHGDTIIDGFGVGDLSYGVIAEREELAREGVLTVAILIDYKSKKVLSDININTVGIMIPKGGDTDIMDLIKSRIIQTIEEQERFDYKLIQNRIRNRIKKSLFRAINKEPMVVVTFYEV